MPIKQIVKNFTLDVTEWNGAGITSQIVNPNPSLLYWGFELPLNAVVEKIVFHKKPSDEFDQSYQMTSGVVMQTTTQRVVEHGAVRINWNGGKGGMNVVHGQTFPGLPETLSLLRAQVEEAGHIINKQFFCVFFFGDINTKPTQTVGKIEFVVYYTDPDAV